MKEIKVNIPDGVNKVTIEIQEDGTTVTQYEKPEVKVEEKYEPKDGDIVASEDGIVAIYKKLEHVGFITTYAGYGNIKHDLTTTEGAVWIHSGLRPATESEKQLLFDVLAKEGKRWNPETKQIEDLPRWRAEDGEKYYYIDIDGEVELDEEAYNYLDDSCHSVGNYFKTREAAERVAEQIREIFKKSKAE